jgi:hypothetical protein
MKTVFEDVRKALNSKALLTEDQVDDLGKKLADAKAKASKHRMIRWDFANWADLDGAILDLEFMHGELRALKRMIAKGQPGVDNERAEVTGQIQKDMKKFDAQMDKIEKILEVMKKDLPDFEALVKEVRVLSGELLGIRL